MAELVGTEMDTTAVSKSSPDVLDESGGKRGIVDNVVVVMVLVVSPAVGNRGQPHVGVWLGSQQLWIKLSCGVRWGG